MTPNLRRADRSGRALMVLGKFPLMAILVPGEFEVFTAGSDGKGWIVVL